MIDLARIPLEELQWLLTGIPKEIERRHALERARVVEELAALARARGFVLQDLLRDPAFKNEEVPVPTVVQRRPAPVKFRHPFNAELTWSGRGRQTKWVVAWLAEGRKMEDLMV
jgi:DNA-binding protein H-NS